MFKNTLLTLAASKGCIEAVRLLISKPGVDINHKDI